MFSLVQFATLIFLSIVRPFDTSKDNVISIINESLFSFLCFIITIFNEKSMWFEGFGPLLISILMMNGFLISFIVIVDIIMSYMKKRKQKKIASKTTEIKKIGKAFETQRANSNDPNFLQQNIQFNDPENNDHSSDEKSKDYDSYECVNNK